MIDKIKLSELLGSYKYVQADNKWVSQRGRATDKDKTPEIFLEYVKMVPEEAQCSLPEFRQAAYDFIQQEVDKSQNNKSFTAYNHLEFAKFLQKDLKMEGTTWNMYKLDGRVKAQAVAQNVCYEATIRYNDSIPVINKKKACAPLSKENVWITLSKLSHDLETIQFKNMQEQLAFCADLNYDKLSSDLFDIAKIPNNDLNRAMLKHWMSNVKRLIYGDKTLYDLCLNLYGPQGSGKTTLSRFLTIGGMVPQGVKIVDKVYEKGAELPGPLQEYGAEISFHDILDPNFFAWASSYHALIVSEPAGESNLYLNRKEVNQFKALLDRDTFTTRVYYTQQTQKTPRTFSIMTSTNKHLYRIISDTSGQRRIYELEMGLKEDGKVALPDPQLYSFPYLDLWKAVDEAESCMSQQHVLWPQLNEVWNTYRANSTIELYFSYSDKYALVDKAEEGVKVSMDDLYADYEKWAKTSHYEPKKRGNFDEDLPDAGVIIVDGSPFLKLKKSGKRGFVTQ